MRVARYALGAVLLVAAERAHAQQAQEVAAPLLTPEQAVYAQEPLAAPSETVPAAHEVESSARLSEAELAVLGLSTADDGLDTDLHFSGFMDVNAAQLLNPHEALLNTRVFGTEASFFVGHLNLYVTKNLTESFSMMAEIRFSYAPNGAQELVVSAAPANTEVIDYSGAGASVRWGSITIERAYGEWSPLPFLSLRLGAFLTPYGIWNVDHGSPVFIPVMRPYAVNGAFFPERQTGLEALGRLGLTPNLTVRYHLTLSNGLGPISEYRDLDSNKGIGGRLALEYIGLGTFQVGGSALYAQTSGGVPSLGINANGTALALNETASERAYVTSVAADVLWKYRGLHLQGEWVGQRWDYTTSGRRRLATAGQLGIPANAVAADTFNWAGYVLVGYRLPWLGIMPFATIEYQRSIPFGILAETVFGQVGLNIRPADAVVVKLEYHAAFSGSDVTNVKYVAAQLAWAF